MIRIAAIFATMREKYMTLGSEYGLTAIFDLWKIRTHGRHAARVVLHGADGFEEIAD
jgi:hypothetical protein